MKSNLNVIIYACLILGIVACKSTKKATTNRTTTSSSSNDKIIKTDDVVALQKLMAGSYNSAAQAAEDSTYYDISLHMYPIWKNKTAKYLYVEQAMSAKQDQPYRQRIYKLESDGNGGLMSHVYTLADAEAAIGKWKTPQYFDELDETILTEREGCTVYMLKHKDGSYSGSTRLDHCKSTLRGAAYATSIVKIRDGSVMSWDQGFDAEGTQVWGAELGGYRFLKVK